ncbi:DUF3810 domain-containing protein [Clostridium sediminicola]|uniref:DUF3810 domain-containing protein n=1 Tax=Clostridium sediminicola TaxID=3114879 RepID=UPI0031F23642
MSSTFIAKVLHSKKNVIRICLIILMPLGIILNKLAGENRGFVERIYSNGINRPMRQALSLITGILPFSLAEVALYCFIGFLIIMIIKFFYNISVKKENLIESLKLYIINVFCIISVIYFLFLILWGFNYNRLPFSIITGYKVQPSSVEELYDLCSDLIIQTNNLRDNVYEDERGIMELQEGYKDVFKRSNIGYDLASEKFQVIGGKYGKPKRVLLSEKMCYTGITGVYFPFTGEANVNVAATDFMLPATVLHEMAHQRGFAREDEANYIAYLTCMYHPDFDFKYSGSLLALIYSMKALRQTDYDKYSLLKENYSDGVKRDLIYLNQFWGQYEGKVEKASTKINDSYLKSNGQENGVSSYGRMVDLLLAERRE